MKANERLMSLRRGRGWTRAELAEKSGVDPRTIEALEQGRRLLNKTEAIRVYALAKTLGCEMTDLLDV